VTMYVSSGPALQSVPYVIGATESDAEETLVAAGFTVSKVDEPLTSDLNDGLVVAQSPEGSTQAEAGSTVTISIGRFTAPTTTTTVAPTTTTVAATTPTSAGP
jgi:beta-lactam-binding protein with PASTA domain